MIIKNRELKYSLFLILFCIIVYISYMALVDIALEKKIKVAREDMHTIGGAIGAFSVDWSQFPVSDDVFSSGSVYHQRYCSDPYQRIDSEMILLLKGFSLQVQGNNLKLSESIYAKEEYNSKPEVYQKIQDMIGPSPKAYLWKPYEELERGRLYSYRKLTTPQAYLKVIPTDPFSKEPPFLYRYGAIMEEGKPFHQFIWILLGNGPDGDVDIKPEYIVKDDRGNLVIYEKYPFDGKPGSFWDLMYDPTNGVQSNGDMVFSGFFK